ncbi:MAG: hypothetical protein R3F11_00085 [Verrucomicrobiales bacterium]
MSNGTETAGASADLPAPKSSASAQPATTSAGSGAVRLAAIAFLGIVALMLLVWPYQHGFTQGSGESRISMGMGIYHIVINKSEWIYCLAVPVLIASWWMDRKRRLQDPVSGDRLGLVLLAISPGDLLGRLQGGQGTDRLRGDPTDDRRAGPLALRARLDARALLPVALPPSSYR